MIIRKSSYRKSGGRATRGDEILTGPGGGGDAVRAEKSPRVRKAREPECRLVVRRERRYVQVVPCIEEEALHEGKVLHVKKEVPVPNPVYCFNNY